MSASCGKRNDLIKGFGKDAGTPLTIFVSILKLFISRTCEMLSFTIGVCCLISRHGCRTFTTRYCLSFYRSHLPRPLYTPLVCVSTQLVCIIYILWIYVYNEINKVKWRTCNFFWWLFCMTCLWTNLRISGSEIEIAKDIGSLTKQAFLSLVKRYIRKL